MNIDCVDIEKKNEKKKEMKRRKKKREKDIRLAQTYHMILIKNYE